MSNEIIKFENFYDEYDFGAYIKRHFTKNNYLKEITIEYKNKNYKVKKHMTVNDIASMCKKNESG